MLLIPSLTPTQTAVSFVLMFAIVMALLLAGSAVGTPEVRFGTAIMSYSVILSWGAILLNSSRSP